MTLCTGKTVIFFIHHTLIKRRVKKNRLKTMAGNCYVDSHRVPYRMCTCCCCSPLLHRLCSLDPFFFLGCLHLVALLFTLSSLLFAICIYFRFSVPCLSSVFLEALLCFDVLITVTS